jgi:hypothetical protein
LQWTYEQHKGSQPETGNTPTPRDDDAATTEALDAVYREEESAVDPVLAEPQWRALGEENWDSGAEKGVE